MNKQLIVFVICVISCSCCLSFGTLIHWQENCWQLKVGENWSWNWRRFDFIDNRTYSKRYQTKNFLQLNSQKGFSIIIHTWFEWRESKMIWHPFYSIPTDDVLPSLSAFVYWFWIFYFSSAKESNWNEIIIKV